MTNLRIGHGYDVHQLVSGRKLVMGGVDIPFEKGLAGHSDADVLLHAIMDALLGAAGLGDIGVHFPPSDQQYRNSDSLHLLRRVVQLLRENGYGEIVNIDATVMAERPRMRDYIPLMIKRIAEVSGMEECRLNIKATTTEKLGFVGREEGIAASAICLIAKDD